MNPIFKFIILVILLSFQKADVLAQKDSTKIWADGLLTTKSMDEGWAINQRIANYAQTVSDGEFIANSSFFLKAAAKSGLAKYLFYDLFYIFDGESKKRKLDKEFNLAFLKMETDPDFSSHDVKYQLYYIYTQFYYVLKDYYYANKYLKLFLKDGITAFPEKLQENRQLNALTTVALINRNTDSLDKAAQQFKAILQLSIVKKNSAWEGITSGNLAYTLQLGNRLQEAIPYYLRDDQLSTETKEFGSALNARISLGEIYLKLKKTDTALRYIDSANKLLAVLIAENKTDSIPYPHEQRDIYSILGTYYNQTGDFKKSNEYFAKVFSLSNSIQQAEKLNRLKQLVQTIEVDKNLNEINDLNKEIQNKRQYLTFVTTVVIAVACILILLSFFLFRLLAKNKKLAAQNEIINQQRTALENINRDNNKLFSIISHDVRGPAASVHRLLQLAGQKKVTSEDFERLLPGLLANSTNLNSTIESLLTWATAQFNNLEAQPESIEVKSFIDNMIPLLHDQAKAKSITIENNCSAQHVLVDKNQFQVIIRNAISNAIKFSHPGAVIRFSSTDADSNIAVSLADAGVGMTTEQIDNIFNKQDFTTTSGTTGEKGIGLGLKLVKEFIEKNSGTFKIESTVGIGTTLTFILPRAKE